MLIFKKCLERLVACLSGKAWKAQIEWNP